MLTTSIPLKVCGAPESLPPPILSWAEASLVKVLRVPASVFDQESINRRHVGMDPNVPSAVPVVLLSHSQSQKKAKAGTGRGESIRRVLNESAPVSSSASPAVLAVKYISDWEVSQFRIDTQPQ